MLEKLLTLIFHLFITPLFHIGETPISLSLIARIILFLLIVFWLTGNFNQFLKKKLLVKLRIDEGNRTAIATIISYTIGSIGCVIVLQATGFNLASLAVIAGGLGVGIGFGLQDITKNFVSGITLLIERTIKVGDFVDFDGLKGYVKEISIRSTIIRTRDGGDVVVPNSHLVENKLLNWSYESFLGRIHIPVGVAYESDTVLVTETLLASAYMESAVLHEPSPEVFFIGFGDNSLNFELRVWVHRIDENEEIKSSLNFIIEHNLAQHGISIPFPQRDLWLRNPEALIPLSRQRKQNSDIQPLPPQNSSENLAKPLSVKDLLQEVNYFKNFTDLELRKLIEAGYRKRLGIGEILFRENDPGDAFYIILSGSVEVFVEKIDKHLSTLTAGNFLGELSLMLGIPRTATVRSLEDTIVFIINHKGFKRLLQEQPELAEVIVQELGKYQEELTQRQQQLRELGLLGIDEDDKNPVLWVRKRLKNLFKF